MPIEYLLQTDDNEYMQLYFLLSGNMYASLCVQRLKYIYIYILITVALIKGNLSNLNNSPTRATLNVNMQGKTILLVLRYSLEIMIVFVVKTGIHIIKLLLF